MMTVYCILPVHGGINDNHIFECLESVSQLAIPKTTIFHLCIAIDGVLTQRAQEYILSYKNSSKNLCSIYFNPGQMGLSRNLNNVLKNLNFENDEFIMRIDADDLVEPLRLKKQLKFLTENPAFDVVASCALRIDEEGSKIGLQDADFGVVQPSRTLVNPIIHSSTMIRSQFFAKYGLYDEAFKYAQDWELWARSCRAGAKFFILPEKLIKFRFMDASIVRRKKTQIYVIKIALRRLRGWVILVVVFRSICIMLIPVYLIKIILQIKHSSKRFMEDKFERIRRLYRI